MAKYLVGSPDAEHFIDLAVLESGTKAMLGDPTKIGSAVGPEIVHAHMALREGARKVAALVADPTRTDVAKHEAAKKVAGEVTDKLRKAKSAIEARANQLRADALRAAECEFGPKPDRAGLHTEVRTWLREQARQPDGLETIRKAMAENDDLASVVYHSPTFLTGLPKSTHETLRLDALEARRPAIYGMISAAHDLDELAPKYDKAISKVTLFFYNPEMANQANKRVEV
ncbi:hypothetical protein [Anaeromyxobacter sp. PSR-1]|uniref:hypothetical protein n=1 Tax=Anaeromyxobacter sp. PSR-1 TaxID=1300915 RepID=UPI0005DFBEC2|nr:hypothetical protein [Anaeromyxobacter sp. PSR-1]GAO01826.1 hypothetical protein PSR1_00687 [Anaeromyxobacter sp. PSR-1]